MGQALSEVGSERREVVLGRGGYELVFKDAFTWLGERKKNSVHGVVTDPPYGLVEYKPEQLEKRENGNGGVWRIPPTYDGVQRSPLPRFTVLGEKGLDLLEKFFKDFAEALYPVLVPGAHVMIATNPLVSQSVYGPMIEAGFEKRGEIIRSVTTLRGGDRPKNAHDEFSMVTVMPRSSWEPWGLFRKPCEGTVADNLRKHGTGGLRRISEWEPFKDLIFASPARPNERELADHPSLKPQALMRQLTRAILPLGRGVILDPFMGSGSTIAAARHNGNWSIGIENNYEYFKLAVKAVPLLAEFEVNGDRANGNRSNGNGRKVHHR